MMANNLHLDADATPQILFATVADS